MKNGSRNNTITAIMSVFIVLLGATVSILPRKLFIPDSVTSFDIQTVIVTSTPFVILAIATMFLFRSNSYTTIHISRGLGVLFAFLSTYAVISVGMCAGDALSGGFIFLLSFLALPLGFSVGHLLGFVIAKLIVFSKR